MFQITENSKISTSLNDMWAAYVVYLACKVKPIDRKYLLDRMDDEALTIITKNLPYLLGTPVLREVDAREILYHMDKADPEKVDNIIR